MSTLSPHHAPASLLEVRGLRARRGGRVVLDGVGFTAGEGSVTVLAGESGSGKTTLLRCIVGLQEVEAGEVLFDGADAGALDPCELRRRVALVAQTPVMLPGDVAANVRYARPDADAGAVLDAVGLDRALLEREAEQLSGGERARVAIARALAHEPRVLLLDEPTASLHEDAAASIERLIAALAERGAAVVVVTHDPAQAARLGGAEVRLGAGGTEARP